MRRSSSSAKSAGRSRWPTAVRSSSTSRPTSSAPSSPPKTKYTAPREHTARAYPLKPLRHDTLSPHHIELIALVVGANRFYQVGHTPFALTYGEEGGCSRGSYPAQDGRQGRSRGYHWYAYGSCSSHGTYPSPDKRPLRRARRGTSSGASWA